MQRIPRITAILVAAPVLCASHLIGQNTTHTKRSAETSVSLGAFGELAASRTHDTITSTSPISTTTFYSQRIEPSAGVLATFRQSFSPWLGYSVNVGWNRSTYLFNSANPKGSFGRRVPVDMYETSVSYVAQKHFTSRTTLFGEAGAGSIGFASIHHSGDLLLRSNDFRPEAITGVGMSFQFAHGLGLRAEYRGLFGKFPFQEGLDDARLKTVISEPALSATYTFGKHAMR